MRAQRMLMVQKVEQYIYVFKVLRDVVATLEGKYFNDE